MSACSSACSSVMYWESIKLKIGFLLQLENAGSSTFKERVMSAAEFLIECGLSKLDWKYNEKDALVRCLCHYFLNKSKAALDQFVDGIRSNKDVFE